MPIRPRRSVLYVPADKPRAIEKARGLDCDTVVLDLEDAVAPEAKAAARETLAALSRDSFPGREFVIRVGSAGMSDPGEAEAVLAARPDAVLVPKVRSAADLQHVQERIDGGSAGAEIALWAMIETPEALLAAGAIAGCCMAGVRLRCLVIGTNDLALETRVPLEPGRAAYVPWFMQIVAAARTQRLDVIDGVLNDFRDEALLRSECLQARSLGMDGKSLIHPGQIAVANAVFRPAPQEVAWAGAVAAAFTLPENKGKGVLAMDGRMIERLHLGAAQRILDMAQACERKDRR
ncbi:citrate lyase subunit beta / citryl-CoA lyase [Faunimonas pinastri]|uniref:Citrate lyase subunit beta / citryl-CoA lyase n=1 Tax=Faunimonas pinastri TaxID=1855383 RepID=A0A1H9MC80_9HYPH|nr:CoA ester lyase [Faunimonas pinastri]SER21047.1 citrate lyase subunit beta / citryl-CoA lyase [Faunimonas pinastri]